MKRILALALVLAVCSMAHPAFAADSRFKVYGAAAWVAPMDESEFSIGTIDDTLEASDAFGYDIGFEWKFTDRLGLDVDYMIATQDIEFGGDKIGEVDFKPLTAALNIHLFDSQIFDLYVAPVASWVDWGDIEGTGGNSDATTDTEFTWGAQIGLDIGLGERVAIVTGLRYLNLSVNAEGEDLGIDPLIARAGIGIRF